MCHILRHVSSLQAGDLEIRLSRIVSRSNNPRVFSQSYCTAAASTPIALSIFHSTTMFPRNADQLIVILHKTDVVIVMEEWMSQKEKRSVSSFVQLSGSESAHLTKPVGPPTTFPVFFHPMPVNPRHTPRHTLGVGALHRLYVLQNSPHSCCCIRVHTATHRTRRPCASNCCAHSTQPAPARSRYPSRCYSGPGTGGVCCIMGGP